MHGSVLVFDEIITALDGYGGAQAELGVLPDLAVFGKAMANGMPISAITGPADLMAYFEDIFVSGTFGGEALSLAAAIATIDKLEAEDIPARLRDFGAKLRARVATVFAEADLRENYLSVGGDWWPGLVANPEGNADPNLPTSLLRQELIANNVLMGATFNLCFRIWAPEFLRIPLRHLNEQPSVFPRHWCYRILDRITRRADQTGIRGKELMTAMTEVRRSRNRLSLRLNRNTAAILPISRN